MFWDGSPARRYFHVFPLYWSFRGENRRLRTLLPLVWSYRSGDNAWGTVFPLAFWYSYGKPGQKHRGIIPFFFQGPDYWAAPLALSGKWKNPDGTRP